MKHAILALALALAPLDPAAAQFVDNGGNADAADTSKFGQQTAFENVTTEFDGISFKLTRLILDPGEADFRAVATLEKTGSGEASVLLLGPEPQLTDELGNVHISRKSTGVLPCMYNSKQWNTKEQNCSGHHVKATRLVAGIPIHMSMQFTQSETDYASELAALSNTATLTLRLVYTMDGFKTMKSNKIVIPAIPLPK